MPPTSIIPVGFPVPPLWNVILVIPVDVFDPNTREELCHSFYNTLSDLACPIHLEIAERTGLRPVGPCGHTLGSPAFHDIVFDLFFRGLK